MEFTLAATTVRREMPAVFLGAALPMFADRLLGILDAAGVDTILDRYRVELAGDGTPHTAYKAVNVAAIACADLKRSEFHGDFEPPLMKFDRLVLAPKKVVGQVFFRVAVDRGREARRPRVQVADDLMAY